MDWIYANLPMTIWLVGVFVLGACVGSLLNVCVARLPLEKSILWPGSRCGSCLQPIRARDNIPIFSYLLLRGRCRTCGSKFSSRYMWVELFTALGFLALFYLEVVRNWHGLPFFEQHRTQIDLGHIPWQGWAFLVHHAALLSFLIVAALCDLDGRVIPLTVTVPGTLLGLLGATLFPWPWPNPPEVARLLPSDEPWFLLPPNVPVPRGLYPWPVWGPLPASLPAGSWQLGLVTGLVGAAVGMFMLRLVRFLFERGLGKEALGLGDADLMMMAGAFLGWQPVVVAFFAGAMVTLLLVLPVLIRRRQSFELPFGPGLAIGVVLTWMAWPWLSVDLKRFMFDQLMVILAAGLMFGGMFVMSVILGLRGGAAEGE